MKVYDETNIGELLAHHDERLEDGSVVGVHVIGGEKRYLSRIVTPSGRKMMAAAPPYSASFPVFPRSEWSAMIKEQKARKRRISDFQYFAPHDQDGYPSCWRNGTAHAGTTRRVIQGLPLKYLSSMSLCPNHSPNTGGDEWDSGTYYQENGAASFDEWANNDPNMSLTNTPPVIEARKHHKAEQIYRLETFDEFVSAALMDPPMPFAVAFNWWSHVISGGDAVEIEAGSFGMMYRNNWGDWGDKNDLGQPGYITMREGHGTPDSGFAIGPVTSSLS